MPIYCIHVCVYITWWLWNLALCALMYNNNYYMYGYLTGPQELEVMGSVQSALHQKVNAAFDQIWSVERLQHYLGCIVSLALLSSLVYTCTWSVDTQVYSCTSPTPAASCSPLYIVLRLYIE